MTTPDWTRRRSRIMPVARYSIDGLEVPVPETSAFLEGRVAAYDTIFAIRPTWGVSRLRDLTEVSGTGAQVTSTGGYIRVEAGSTSAGYAQLQTKQRGQYLPGATGQVGLGIRIPTAPTDDQYIEWGLDDEDNGFGWGVDSTGLYIFDRDNGTTTKVYRSSFNVDTLDGNGPSGVDFVASHGHVFHVDFTWYGYGGVEWKILEQDETTQRERLITVHRTAPIEQLSIQDPNQPITVRVDNGGGTVSQQIEAQVGGRQYAVGRVETSFNSRNVPEIVRSYQLTTNQNVFEPILAIRKKATFNGRNNSTDARFADVKITADQDIEVRVEFDATTSGATYGSATGWDAAETSVEFALPTFTVSTAGLPVQREVALGSTNKQLANATVAEDLPIVGSSEVVIYVAPRSAQTTTIDLIADVIERW